MSERRDASKWVCVAVVAAPHGVRGALKLRCFTERPEAVATYGELHDRSGQPLFKPKVIGATRGGIVVEIEGVRDRDAAEALRGTELFVARAALPALEPGEFYYDDLEGLDVQRTDGSHLGVIRTVANYGAGDVIEVVTDDGRPLALPFDHRTVPTVDLEHGRIVVEPPAELVGEDTR